jgi:hypothetical protein
MIKDIYKFKLPRGYALVAKTSCIEAWIQEEDITSEIMLYYGASGDTVLSAHFYLPSPGIPCDHQVLSIGTVKSEIVGEIRERIKTEVFPALASWIKQIEGLDKSSPAYKNRCFYVRWDGRNFSIEKD